MYGWFTYMKGAKTIKRNVGKYVKYSRRVKPLGILQYIYTLLDSSFWHLFGLPISSLRRPELFFFVLELLIGSLVLFIGPEKPVEVK